MNRSSALNDGEQTPIFQSRWVLALALAAVTAGFFFRHAYFNDEFVNFYKASQGSLFDYADRPAYYLLNLFALQVFGYDPRSLTLIGAISFVVAVLLLYRIGKAAFDRPAGTLAAVLLLVSPLVFSLGIRGMPHLPAGAVALVPVLALIQAQRQPLRSWREYAWAAAAAFTAVGILAFHPTLVAVCAGVAGWLGLALLRPPRLPVVLSRIAALWGLAGGLLAGAILQGLFVVYRGSGYVAEMLAGSRRIGLETTVGEYVRAAAFYPALLIRDHPWILTILALLLMAGLVFRWRRGRAIAGGQAPGARAAGVTLLWLFVVGLAVLTLADLREERVLVALVPLWCLALATLGVWVRHLWAAVLRPMGRTILAAALPLLAILVGLPAMSAEFRAIRDEEWRHRFEAGGVQTAFYALLEGLPKGHIGFVGLRQESQKVRRLATLTGYEYSFLGQPGQLFRRGRLEHLRQLLLDGHIAYVVLDDRRPRANLVEDWLRELGGTPVAAFDGLGHQRLWRVLLEEERQVLAHWPMNLKRGAVKEVGPFGLTGNVQAAPRQISGCPVGRCVEFRQRDDGLRLPMPVRFMPDSGLEMTLYVRALRGKGGLMLRQRDAFVLSTRRGRLFLRLTDAEPQVHNTEIVLKHGQWHHVRIRWLRNDLRMWVDDEQVYQAEIESRYQPSRAPLLAGNGFEGSLDEIVIRRPRPLTETHPAGQASQASASPP